MATDQSIYSDLAIPPGEYLEEVLDELGMTKVELAKRMNRPAPKLSAVFKGDKAITPDTALQLEKAVGVPAHIWLGLEADFRLVLARRQRDKEQEELKTETYLVTKYRYADLVRLGLLAKTTRPVDKVLSLQKYFGVTSLKTIPDLRRYQPVFRVGKQVEQGSKPEAIATWLRMGELAAVKIHCTPFNKSALENTVAKLRQLTLQPPAKFQDALQHSLASCGVAIVICPFLPGTGIHGATFWMGARKAVVMMTFRYKWADIFWFSLFHELGHIFLHGCKNVVLEGIDVDPNQKKREKQADKFAADTLVPPKEYETFVDRNSFYPEDICRFSDLLGIDPGIVVGRLQNDGLLERSWHNGLRTRLETN